MFILKTTGRPLYVINISDLPSYRACNHMKTVLTIVAALAVAVVLAKDRSSRGSNYGSHGSHRNRNQNRNDMKTSTTMYMSTDSWDDYSSYDMSTTEIRTTGWSKDSSSSSNNRKRKNRHGNGSGSHYDDDEDDSNEFWTMDSYDEDLDLSTTDSYDHDMTTTDETDETTSAGEDQARMQMANRAGTKSITSHTNDTNVMHWNALIIVGIIGGAVFIACLVVWVMYSQKHKKYNNVAAAADDTEVIECDEGKTRNTVSYLSSGDEGDGEALIIR
eukprot:860355_1